MTPAIRVCSGAGPECARATEAFDRPQAVIPVGRLTELAQAAHAVSAATQGMRTRREAVTPGTGSAQRLEPSVPNRGEASPKPA